MSLLNILHSWEACKESEKYDQLCDSIKLDCTDADIKQLRQSCNCCLESSCHKLIKNGVSIIELSEVNDVKIFNSLLLAPFCDNYPSSVQQSILQLIQFFGRDIVTRRRLLTTFSILKSLVYGLTSISPADKTLLLKTLQCYTFDLHHFSYIEQEVFSHALKFILRVIRQPKPEELLEPALGIFASLSHFDDLVRQCVTRKDDFEALRKCLLYIMNSDTVSQSCLVYSIAIRFYLWKSADKFFEGLNVHKTIEVLFNLLLNGEIDSGGLCAGELLGDMCNEPVVMNLLGSFPKLRDSLNEVILQLRSKDPELVIKLLHLLRQLLENGTNQDVCCSVVDLFLSPNSLIDNKATQISEPLANLFSLISAPNDLVASASVDFIMRLLHMAEKSVENNANATTLTTPAIGHMLELTIPALRSAYADARQSCSRQQLLRCILLIRLSELFVHRLKEDPEHCVAPHLRLVEQLAKSVPPLVVSQLEGNALFGPQQTSLDIDTCYTSAGLAIDATGLLYTCAELLATPSTDDSTCTSGQRDEVSLTQPTGDTNDEESDEATAGVQTAAAKQCGRSLQALLESPQMPCLLALGLLTRCPDSAAAGLEVVRRSVVLRLLTVIFSLHTFDVDLYVARLAHHMDRLQSLPFYDDKEPPRKMARFALAETSGSRKPISFLSAWFRSTSEGIATHHRHPLFQCSLAEDPRQLCSLRRPNPELEQKVDKILSTHHDDTQSPVGKTSELLSVFEYKIRLLQSREEVLESSVAANAEALASANRLCEHYRERALLSETESGRLRALQLDAVARLEEDRCQLTACTNLLEQSTGQLKDVRLQFAQKQQESHELTQKNASLQSKLTAAREHNQALDVTLDEYRRQLDQAKAQIESQTNQIAKFTQITRLINDLTGNPTADLQASTAVTLSSTTSPGDGGATTTGGTGTGTGSSRESTATIGGGKDTACRVSGGSSGGGGGRKIGTRSNRR